MVYNYLDMSERIRQRASILEIRSTGNYYGSGDKRIRRHEKNESMVVSDINYCGLLRADALGTAASRCPDLNV
jgi:hypothetical protein